MALHVLALLKFVFCPSEAAVVCGEKFKTEWNDTVFKFNTDAKLSEAG